MGWSIGKEVVVDITDNLFYIINTIARFAHKVFIPPKTNRSTLFMIKRFKQSFYSVTSRESAG